MVRIFFMSKWRVPVSFEKWGLCLVASQGFVASGGTKLRENNLSDTKIL